MKNFWSQDILSSNISPAIILKELFGFTFWHEKQIRVESSFFLFQAYIIQSFKR
jgi:hypothetical protein